MFSSVARLVMFIIFSSSFPSLNCQKWLEMAPLPVVVPSLACLQVPFVSHLIPAVTERERCRELGLVSLDNGLSIVSIVAWHHVALHNRAASAGHPPAVCFASLMTVRSPQTSTGGSHLCTFAAPSVSTNLHQKHPKGAFQTQTGSDR